MITTRPSKAEDAQSLIQWFSEPGILRWFPMINEREVEDAVRIWMAYSKLGASLTVDKDQIPYGMALLYIQPYKKLAHQCLFTIIVDASYRGQGIGTKLLEELIQLGKERFHLEMLHLEVYEGNPAISLYERFGFVEFGRQKHFIKEEGQYRGKILMQKKI
jgi:ribosomal protein S18 acetylase RimI-like enzyme